MNWNEEAYRILRKELVRRKVTYALLQRRLEAIGVEETSRSIANKISRGTFSFSFFIQCMRAIGAQVVEVGAVEPLPSLDKEKKEKD